MSIYGATYKIFRLFGRIRKDPLVLWLIPSSRSACGLKFTEIFDVEVHSLLWPPQVGPTEPPHPRGTIGQTAGSVKVSMSACCILKTDSLVRFVNTGFPQISPLDWSTSKIFSHTAADSPRYLLFYIAKSQDSAVPCDKWVSYDATESIFNLLKALFLFKGTIKPSPSKS